MILILGDIRDILDNEAGPGWGIAQEVVQNWQNQFQKDGADAYVSRLVNVQRKITDARKKIHTIIGQNARFRDEILPTVDDRLIR